MPVSRNNLPLARFAKYWLPVVGYAALIFYSSSLPAEEIPLLFNYQDMVFHIIEYAVFALLFSRAIKAYYPKFLYQKRFWLVLVFCVAYALSDEFHQAFVPGRDACLGDVAYDGIGVIISNIFYR